MAAKTSWRRYGTKLRHCHPMCRHPRLVLSIVSRLSASLSEPTTTTKRQRRHQLCCLCDRFLHHSRRRRDNSSWNLSTCMVLGKRRPKPGSAVRYEVCVRWPDQTEWPLIIILRTALTSSSHSLWAWRLSNFTWRLKCFESMHDYRPLYRREYNAIGRVRPPARLFLL